ncbi:MAG: ABC transporter ATP-binding protein/permease, partial [Hyphomicrobiaceae bacterium]|nr:ABC transporter ATP-binding protein/permease [Hyphomicrobiaceae bacterium]
MPRDATRPRAPDAIAPESTAPKNGYVPGWMRRASERVFTWAETRIDAFASDGAVRPPDSLTGFYWFYVRQAWPAFVAMLVAGFLGAVIEASMFAFIASLVDRMKDAANPPAFLAQNWGLLATMAFVVLVLRPIVFTAHDIIKHQIIGGQFTTLIRWQSHAYVLRQSLGFFQNDFAGRVANKVMQVGPGLRESVVQAIDAIWFVAIYWISAIVLFSQVDGWLLMPILAWFAAYVWAMLYFVPRLKKRAVETSEARSMLTGRIVDSYTNMMT